MKRSRVVVGISFALGLAGLGLLVGSRGPAARPLPERLREGLEERAGHRADRPDAAVEFFRAQRVNGPGGVPSERYLAALERMRDLPRHSTAAGRFLPSRAAAGVRGGDQLMAADETGATWEPLGPGNIGGRTRSILVDPTDPSVMYAGAVAGGVWTTTDGGAHWAPLTDTLPNLAVATLAFGATPQVLYAGTGEGVYNGDAVRGAGIFASSDGGATWSQMAGTDVPDFYHVNKIVVGPASGEVYAATRTGVWRFDGASWAHALDPQRFGGCLDLAARADGGGDTVFAACGTFVQAAVYRAAQAQTGAAFSVVLEDTGMGRTSLAIAPSSPTTIYALSAEIRPGPYQDGLHAVFRSDAGGDPGTWTATVRNTSSTHLDTLLLSNTVYASLVECRYDNRNQYYNQGWYDNVIAVDPTNPDRVWAGGIDLFRSDDGGQHWGLASFWWGTPGHDPSYAHADQHAIVFPPDYDGATNKRIYFGNDGGLFTSADALGATLTGDQAPCDPSHGTFAFSDLNHGYGATQFYHGSVFPGATAYYGGTQDNGTVLGTDAWGSDGWVPILGGDGGVTAINPNRPMTTFYGEFTGASIAKTIDGGSHFFDATKGIDQGDGFLFITPYVLDARNPQVLWTGGAHLWRSTNGGAFWRRASAAVVHDPNAVSAIAISPLDSNRLLIGDTAGFIRRTTAGLAAGPRTRWSGTQITQGWVSEIAFQPGSSSVAYATVSTFGVPHVWQTTDGGLHWAPLDGATFPDVPADSIAVDPGNPGNLYVGTDVGVFFSGDGGASWAVESTGFPATVADHLAVSPALDGGNWLFAFTHGRGVWRVHLQ